MTQVILTFFVAYGIVLGGAVTGGMGAFFTQKPPLQAMIDLAEQLKIWGLVGALGGTFDSFRQIDLIFEGHISPIIKQLIMILSAFAGAHLGTSTILWLVQART